MQEIVDKLKDANRLMNSADHLAYVTYPLIKDNKLIITIAENLNSALLNLMEALLMYERAYKRIPPYPENFDMRLQIFKEKIANRYNIDRSYIVLIEDLKKLVYERKKSTMEFIRHDKYVLFNKNMSIKSITLEKVKKYLNESKPLFLKVNTLLKDVRPY